MSVHRFSFTLELLRPLLLSLLCPFQYRSPVASPLPLGRALPLQAWATGARTLLRHRLPQPDGAQPQGVNMCGVSSQGAPIMVTSSEESQPRAGELKDTPGVDMVQTREF